MLSQPSIGVALAAELGCVYRASMRTLNGLYETNRPIDSLLFAILPTSIKGGQVIVTETDYIAKMDDVAVKPPHFVINGGVYELLLQEQYRYWYVKEDGVLYPLQVVSPRVLLEGLPYKLKAGSSPTLRVHRLDFLATPTLESRHATA